MGKNLNPQAKSPMKSPRKRPFTLGRPTTARSRPQTAPGAPTSASTHSGANIKVIVRIRPPNAREHGDNSRIVVKTVDNQMLVFDPEEESQPFFYHGVQQTRRDLLKKANKNMQFLFDRVFGFDSTNQHIFEDSTRDLIGSLMDGYNCSVFVYGATGAGKTHTMLGHNGNPGITFLTMEELFRQKQSLHSERDFELGVSYLEVYNENVQDLLNPGVPLHLREDGKYGVIVAGIQVKRIEEPVELYELLEKGNKNRTQHPTDANAESSRSHAVFQVYLRMCFRSTGQVRLAKLSMIDLAGSERGAATGCAGARFTEGANINKSLLALGNCINSLADGHRHIPYRDSKLTRLLKDSLGGNCQTVMIANISPSSLSYEDTYNTLKYAARAKKIKSHVKKNVVNCELHVDQYVKMVDELNKEVERLKNQLKEKEKAKYMCEACGGGAGDGPSPNVINNGNINVTAIVKPSAEHTMKGRLLEIYAERIGLFEKLHELRMTEKVHELQRQLKVDADSRLSDLCVNTVDKEKGHKRMGGTMKRLQKQVDDLKHQQTVLQQKNEDLRKQAEKIVKDNPDLESCASLEAQRVNYLQMKYEKIEMEKLHSLQSKELQKRGEMMENLAEVLKPCYLLLRGSGSAPENIIAKYKNLMRQLQGIESVSFHPDTAGGTQSPNVLTENGEVVSPTVSPSGSRLRTKRKHSSSEEGILETTFTLSSNTGKSNGNTCAEQLLTKVYVKQSTSKPKFSTVCADQVLTKVYEPPVKKLATTRSASPHMTKENRHTKTIGTMGTTPRFHSAPSTGKNVPLHKKKPLAKVAPKARPDFRL